MHETPPQRTRGIGRGDERDEGHGALREPEEADEGGLPEAPLDLEVAEEHGGEDGQGGGRRRPPVA